jgi:hypothetical protein
MLLLLWVIRGKYLWLLARNLVILLLVTLMDVGWFWVGKIVRLMLLIIVLGCSVFMRWMINIVIVLSLVMH